MAVAMTASGAAPIVAAALQNRRQLGLDQLLDEPANAATNRRLQRIKPILAQKWPRCGRCDSLFHGVISWRLAGRLLGCFPIRRLRRLQFLPTLRHDRGHFEFGNVLVGYVAQELHEAPQAVAVSNDQHALAPAKRRCERFVPIRHDTIDRVL